MLRKIRIWIWKRRYRPGSVISQFVAIDIRREVEVIGVSEIESGIIRARVRTWNVLYASKGNAPQSDFGEVHSVKIAELWKWTGEPWGGRVGEEP